MKKHSFILTTAILLFVSSSFAVTAPPNQTTTIDNLTGHNQSQSSSVVKNTFPFDAAIQNQSLGVSPSYQLEPKTYTGAVTLRTGNNTTTRNYQVTVPEVANWTVTPRNLKTGVSVGSSGELNNITIGLKGNTETRLTANITGNLSEYYDTAPFFTVYPSLSKQVTVGYRVPSTTSFGYYTGDLILEDEQGRNQTVNLSATFKDRTKPEIGSADFPDIMATQVQKATVEASDNLKIAAVQAEILRTDTVKSNNETVEVNKTVGDYRLNHVANSDDYELSFEETGEIGTYYVNLTVNDTSGNTVYQQEKFRVNGLDAVQITEQDFEFNKIKDRSEAQRVVISNKVKSPFNLSVKSLTYEGNTTLKIGIIPPDASQPRFFEDGKLSFKETGEYALVVKSVEEEPEQGLFEYTGSLRIEVPPQHHELQKVFFGGKIDSFGYPEPKQIYEGSSEFEGYIGYSFDSVEDEFEGLYGSLDSDQGVDYAYKISRIPVDACRGNEDWGSCSTLTMGEYQDTQKSNEELREKAGDWQLIGALAVIAFFLYMLKERRRGLFATVPKFKKSELDKTWEDFENDIEV